MSEWIILKGNTAVQDIPVTDQNGDLVQDLADAEEIKFEIKLDKTKDALVTKTKDDGIEVNKPETGYLRLTLTPDDTDLSPKRYVFALQITWSASRIYEIAFSVDGINTNILRIEQDII